jgi:hypothetical protein
MLRTSMNERRRLSALKMTRFIAHSNEKQEPYHGDMCLFLMGSLANQVRTEGDIL